MLIGELSAKTGLSRETIRFYERLGLIRIGRKQRRDNNDEEYAVLARLLTIRRMRDFGFTLREAVDLLDMIAVTCGKGSRLSEKKMERLDEKIRKMLFNL